MTSGKRHAAHRKGKRVRCGIYCRKSTDEGLDNGFSSLDAQRTACEAFVQSQAAKGWICLPERYDDGGYTGANTDRPALHRLLADVDAGKVDCVIVVKVDRMSRSLLDFGRIMERLDSRGVAFVAVTQAFDSSTSSGRLMMNVLSSFSEFERRLISERTSDRMGAAKRRGKWIGGYPPLGYNVSPEGGRLIVNVGETQRVREIFALYLKTGSLRQTVRELNRRGWRTKEWVTKAGTKRGGEPFHKSLLGRVIGNCLLVGRVHYRGRTYPGEHKAIVDVKTWERAQKLLRRGDGQAGWNETGGLLKGLLWCASCGAPMASTYSKGRNGCRYRYYVCRSAQRNGWDSCPAPSLPAGEIEAFVADRIKAVGGDAKLCSRLIRKVRVESRKGRASGERDRFDGKGIAATLEELAGTWDALAPREQARIVHYIIERVEHQVSRGAVTITFSPSGLGNLAQEVAVR